MKKLFTVSSILLFSISYFSFTHQPNKGVFIPPSIQRVGNAAKGYQYLITGDYLKSGIPYNLFVTATGKDKQNLLQRDSLNANVAYSYTVATAPNGEKVVAPNCLQCHAEKFDGKLYVGLGNASIDFTKNQKLNPQYASFLINLLKKNPKQAEAANNFLRAVKTVGPYMNAETKGVNLADRLAGLLVAHINPETLVWSDTALLTIPNEIIPTDVPAWWLLKKKNAMFYNGFGRGDFSKFLMASNLLTTKDTIEANEVDTHFADVLAYIQSIEPPQYPKSINQKLAKQGKKIFINNCATCHGSYGNNESYPNLLIPIDEIETDPALCSSNYSAPQFVDWFNKSWFSKGSHAAKLVPFEGYIAPPLNGIWVTAPYLHNGSIPTLEALLNSSQRPTYWSRNFDTPKYDYNNIGWKFTTHTQPNGTAVYNTTLTGYGNQGHYFGDKLSDKERKAVIEYLKML